MENLMGDIFGYMTNVLARCMAPKIYLIPPHIWNKQNVPLHNMDSKHHDLYVNESKYLSMSLLENWSLLPLQIFLLLLPLIF